VAPIRGSFPTTVATRLLSSVKNLRRSPPGDRVGQAAGGGGAATVRRWRVASELSGRDYTRFCGTGFKPVKKHGQDSRATLPDTEYPSSPLASVATRGPTQIALILPLLFLAGKIRLPPRRSGFLWRCVSYDRVGVRRSAKRCGPPLGNLRPGRGFFRKACAESADSEETKVRLDKSLLPLYSDGGANPIA
jgi:hypothetical protein